MKEQSYRLNTGSTMAQTGQDSRFFKPQMQEQRIFNKIVQNNKKENNRYQNQESIIDQDNQSDNGDINGSFQQNQEQEQFSNNDNQNSPLQIERRNNDQINFFQGQTEAISNLLIKNELMEITQPYFARKTQKCQCFQIKTQKQFDFKKQKEKLINLGKSKYDKEKQEHNNILYSINFNIHKTDKLTFNYIQQIVNLNINLFQLIYSLSCTQDHQEEVMINAADKKDQILNVLLMISNYILQALQTDDLDSIFKKVQQNGETIHNCLTQIHVAIFSNAFLKNEIQNEQIAKLFSDKQISVIFQEWKNKKLNHK